VPTLDPDRNIQKIEDEDPVMEDFILSLLMNKSTSTKEGFLGLF
jgi:hypothetical protein